MLKKTKIFQVIPDLGVAGAEIMLENLTTGLFNAGFEVSVVSLFNEQSAITKRLEDRGIRIYYLEKKKGLDIKVIFSLYELFIKECPIVIHTHRYAMQYTVPAAIMAKIPIKIHTVHNIAEKEVGKIQRRLHWFFYKYCRVIPVAISPIVKQSLVKEYSIPKNKIPMIYNGIDLKKCIPKKDYIEQNDKFIMLHIGRFAGQKNHLRLIESFKIVHDNRPNTVLKLIGIGELEQAVRDKVNELNLVSCVEFIGLKSCVYTFLYEADTFVLPSLWEGMPITLIEAMGTGLPIVATKVGGIPDMIKDNVNGLLVDVSKEQIAEALLKLINNINLRQYLGNCAKVSSEQFSMEKMVMKYVELYEKQIVHYKKVCKNIENKW